MPLPFPSCPRCYSSWVRSYHRNCAQNGEILVDPYQQQARCSNCTEQWHILSTTFYCSCGYVFQATDVQTALSSAALIRKRLLQQVQDMEVTESRINQKTRASLNQWIYDKGYEFARLIGVTAGTIQRWLENILEL